MAAFGAVHVVIPGKRELLYSTLYFTISLATLTSLEGRHAQPIIQLD